MNLKHYFDLSRFRLLLKMELFRSRKALVMTLVTLFGLMFIVGLVLDLIVSSNKLVFEHEENFASGLIIGGFILSSLAFSDLGNSLKRYHYLTLPASTFEKFICMWLLTSFGWILLFTVSFTLYTFIANPVGQLLFGHITFLPFRPLTEFTINAMKYYFICQGIFLVGAVYFKGYVLPKTLFTLVVVALVAGILAYFLLRETFMMEHECSGYDCEVLDAIGVHPVWRMITWFFWWAFAPLCWVITYVGLKEKETGHGV